MPAVTSAMVMRPALAEALVALAEELVVALLAEELVAVLALAAVFVVLAEALLALPDELLAPLAIAAAKNCRPALSAARPRNCWNRPCTATLFASGLLTMIWAICVRVAPFASAWLKACRAAESIGRCRIVWKAAWRKPVFVPPPLTWKNSFDASMMTSSCCCV